MMEVKIILRPTDFSEPSLTATKYALELARRFDSTLHLLQVIEDRGIYIPIFESYPLPSREEFEKYAREQLDSWIQPDNTAGLHIRRRWVHGYPFPQIIREAKKQAVDLIVIGTPSRSLVSQMLLGSVAEKIVRKAPCAVLSVRPETHQFVHP
jgi:nucleotide-binding universal stress UspA family protein